jgi:hypothetical protein
MEKPEIPLSEFAQMYKSEPWKAHMARLKEIVDAAYEAMVGNISNRPMTYMRLQLRWQQREAMYRASMIIAEDTIKAHEEELEQFQRDFEALSREAQ